MLKIKSITDQTSVQPDEYARIIDRLKRTKNHSVGLDEIYSVNGHRLYRVAFCFLSWSQYRRTCRCFAAPHFHIASAFIGSKAQYEQRMYAICFAKVAETLRDALGDDLTEEQIMALTRGVLKRKRRYATDTRAQFDFNPCWDVETINEMARFRNGAASKHDLRTIESVDDINANVLRILDQVTLSCRRLTRKFVLGSRYYAGYFDSVDEIKAIDCSFKYTGSTYAFRLAMKTQARTLALHMPEVFFKKAGQKIRVRQYAGWLKNSGAHLRDLSDSTAFDQGRDIKTWNDLERHSNDWHERMRMRHRRDLVYYDYSEENEPFEFSADISAVTRVDGYEFTVLQSPDEVEKEGSEMGHCVRSYIPRIAAGDYIVYRAMSEHERATVGILLGTNVVSVDQIRGKYNSAASEALQSAANDLAREITFRICGLGTQLTQNPKSDTSLAHLAMA